MLLELQYSRNVLKSSIADAREAAKDQVNLIEKEIRQIRSKIMNLENLSIKSTESLVVGTDFKADEWVTQMFKLRDDLSNAEICLEIAQNIIMSISQNFLK